MRAPRLPSLACPACRGAIDASSSSFIDCSSCGASLAVRIPDSLPRRALLPAIGSDRALVAARRCWQGPLIPADFAPAGKIETPHLVFVAFYEIERTSVRDGVGRRIVVESLDRVPAAELPGVRLEAIDVRALLSIEEQAPFDARLPGPQGFRFDPSRSAEEAAPIDSALQPLESRVSIVYVPVWLVRCRYGRNLYEVVVNAGTGTVLCGRAPADRDARLPQAIAALYPVALVAALMVRAGLPTASWVVQLHEVGIAAWLGILALMAWLLSWSWDRMRFRYEVVVEGEKRFLRGIHRPERTAFEKIRDSLLETARALFRENVRRRSAW